MNYWERQRTKVLAKAITVFSVVVFILLIALPASASYNVFYANTNFDTQFGPQYGQKILVTPVFYSNSLAPLQPHMYSCGLSTDTYPAGFWVSNMLSGRYLFTVQSTPQPTPRIFVIPDGSGNYTLSTADVVATAAGTGFPSYADITNYVNAHSSALAAATLGLSNAFIVQFGAVGGDVDDTAAFQSAADSGFDVFVPSITNGYTVSNIILKDNSHLRGGGSARLKMKSTATGKFVYAQSSAATNIIFAGFVLDGLNVGASAAGGTTPWTFTAGYAVVSSFTTDRSGLYFYNNQTNSFISALLVKNFSNKGIWIEGGLGSFPQPTSHTLSGYDLRLENCYQGIMFTNSAEYCSFSDVNCFHCGEAVAIWSGNVSIRGGVMTRNGCGIRVVGSGVTNPAHGSVEDIVLNHNDVAIVCTDFNNGFNFNNLIILGGGGGGGGNPILLTNTCGVNIQNSTLNSGMFASADGGLGTANGYNYIDHCKVTGHVPIFQTSSGHLIYNEAVDYGVLTAPQVTNNYNMTFGSSAVFLGTLSGNGSGLSNVVALRATVATNTFGGLSYDSSNGNFTNGAGNGIMTAGGVIQAGFLSGTAPVAAVALAVAAGAITGTMLDSQLSSNVGLLNRNPQTWTGSNHIAGAFEGSGFNLTNLNASQLATGLIPKAQAGSISNTTDVKITGTAPTIRDMLIWDGTNWTNAPSMGYTIDLFDTGNNSMAANTSYYYGKMSSRIINTSYGIAQVDIPRAGRITRVQYKDDVSSTLGSGEVVNFWIELNNATDVFNWQFAMTAAFTNNVVTGSQAVAVGDTIVFKVTTPATWATPATGVRLVAQVYIEP